MAPVPRPSIRGRARPNPSRRALALVALAPLAGPAAALKYAAPSLTVDGVAAWLSDRTSKSGRVPSKEFLTKNAELALQAARLSNCSGALPEDVFLRDVVPFRHLDEPVDEWRPVFYERLLPVVQSKCSLKDMADAVIPAIWKGALGNSLVFKGNSTPEVMAPLTETLAKGYASCTGLSILVASALRSVGVPARVVGVPEWNLPTGGNHNWVEVWFDGGWHFTDATPTDRVDWDNAWFIDNTKKGVPGTIHGVYTATVDPTEADGNYTYTWREPNVEAPAVDRTPFYKAFEKRPDGVEDPDWQRYREASEGLR